MTSAYRHADDHRTAPPGTVIDPVRGMTVTLEHNSRLYPVCKEVFSKNVFSEG